MRLSKVAQGGSFGPEEPRGAQRIQSVWSPRTPPILPLNLFIVIIINPVVIHSDYPFARARTHAREQVLSSIFTPQHMLLGTPLKISAFVAL